MLNFIYIFMVGKHLENTVKFKEIAIDNAMKLKFFFISSLWLDLFEYIVGDVYIDYL